MTMVIDGSSGVTFPNSTIQASAGSVLQVVNATYGTATTTASGTYTDTGLTATITPKFATSKILVLVNQAGCNAQTNANGVSVQLVRTSTALGTFAAYYSYTTGGSICGASISYLDSPATTSATTYKTQQARASGAGNVQTQSNDALSTITLMEIAA